MTAAALGAVRYARDVGRGGYRDGHRSRALTGPTGPLALTPPRGALFTATGTREWASALVPRYQRRLREVNDVAAQSAVTAFEREWASRCPGVVRSLQEGGEELLTFFQFPDDWRQIPAMLRARRDSAA